MSRYWSVFFCSVFSFSVTLTAEAQSAPILGGAVQSMNPDISVSVLTLYKQSKYKGAKKTEADGGFSLQETELQLAANVDPYIRASALLSIHPAESPEASTQTTGPVRPEEKGSVIEPEEVYLETIAIPYVTFKAGRFHTALGRHNLLHTHSYPFIDSPLINQRLLGADGLTETGLSAAVLVPAPWYLEATVQAVQGDSTALFASESASDLASIYHVKNLFEIADSTTLDFGLSGASGKNFYNKRSTVEGADFTFKWRPVQGGKYTSVIFAGEYLQGSVRGREEDSKLRGFASWLQYQCAERWWVQARTEEAGSPADSSAKQHKQSALVSFFPSEFSGVRLQYDRTTGGGKDPLDTVLVQGNLVIGAHPAHSY